MGRKVCPSNWLLKMGRKVYPTTTTSPTTTTPTTTPTTSPTTATNTTVRQNYKPRA